VNEYRTFDRKVAYVFVDLETTGLDCERDVITEMAWIFYAGDLAVERHYYPKYEGFPSLWSAQHTAAWRPDAPVDSDGFVGQSELQTVLAYFFDDCLRLARDQTTVYLVGACPAFDDRFLRKCYREIPYNYHVIDIEALVMGSLGLPYPPPLRDLRALLGLAGENENPHDALADAREAKLIFERIINPDTVARWRLEPILKRPEHPKIYER
jgi:DNA polymerase III epsilon subunit-like protein